MLNLLIKLKTYCTVSQSKSECLRNRPLNYKAHSVWRYFTLNDYFCFFRRVPWLCLSSFFREDFRSAERYVRLKQTRACSANELPLEALKHSVIRYNCVGNTLGCVLAVCIWCWKGGGGRMERREWDRNGEV